ncbi:MAG: hypothetical protein NT106_13645 [Candidatus Sumerlaeota bacterium]|nr:hypothetical protein [Candidatus Sumerlaeota bacterium]
MKDPTNFMILGFTGFVIFFFGAIVWVVRKIRERKEEEKRALEEFQKEMEKDFSPSSPTAAEINPLQPTTPVTEAPPPPQAPVVSPAPTAAPQPARAAVERVISRLRDAGLFISDEGPYMLLDPSGSSVMVRLAKNKTALIVPRFESEHFIIQAMRRFDYIFLIIGEERTIVLNKMEDYLADRWEL